MNKTAKSCIARMNHAHRAFLPSLIAACLTSAGAAHATLYTVEFTGTVLGGADFTLGQPLATGTSFSGYMTYDAAELEFDTGDSTYRQARNDSGCYVVSFGVCTAYNGMNTPIVTDYRIVFGTKTFEPFDPLAIGTLPIYDGSLRANYEEGVSEQWVAFRDQKQEVYSGDAVGAYTLTYYSRFLQLSVADGSTLLAGPVADLNQGFDAAALVAGQLNVSFQNYSYSQRCTSEFGCNTLDTYNAGSFYIGGTLTSATFYEGSARVSTPGTLASLGLGAMLMAWSMRRRASSSTM